VNLDLLFQELKPWAGPRFVISSSAGNDSTALIQWAFENALAFTSPVVVAYCNTGWSAPGWDSRIKTVSAFAERCGFETVEIPSMGMSDLVRLKKGFPGNGMQFCTTHLKIVPFLNWIDNVDPQRQATVLIGKRRAESIARRDTPEFIERSEVHGDRKVWHPLYLHDDDLRDGLLDRAGFEVLPHRSSECSPCVNANRDDFKRLTVTDISKVSSLEVEIGKPMFRPKRFDAMGIYGVMMWAQYGKNHEAELPSDQGCGSSFGCGL
jgi:3'-phosphoadenosine 5'-phosphosulfate sulfotransferase (PAPS reductase)/FAD synthetase